uniref:Uncharacterized protein n=1 Tax=Cyanothece sp. (strain PCC 7425 / ATCC 29141) TaxID=395961 RepID=B8HLX1_CYAP4
MIVFVIIEGGFDGIESHYFRVYLIIKSQSSTSLIFGGRTEGLGLILNIYYPN